MKIEAGTPLTVAFEWVRGERQIVGRLATRDRRTWFEFAPSFLEHPLPLSPLKLASRTGVAEGPRRPFDGLHGVFADSLPDAWGRLLLDRRARRLGISAATLGPLDRLACVGSTGIGALVYEPAYPTEADGAIDLDVLAAASHALLEGNATEVLPQLLHLGGSPGGARPKVLLGLRPTDGQVMAGVEALPADHRPVIVKFRAPGDPIDAGPIEHAYAAMARAAGLQLPETWLLPSTQGPPHFAIERFDRADDRRTHQHSLAGLLEADAGLPALDYEHLLRVALRLTRDQRAVGEAFRRAAFNVFAHNRDDHGRQFTFLMDRDGVWTLAPAYDLTFAQGPGGEHCTAVAGEGRAPGAGDLRRLAATLSVSHVDAVMDEVRAAVADWSRFAAEAGVSRASRERIAAVL